MKYIVVLCDGMADLPIPALSGKTPMTAAKKPNMDFLARMGITGLVKTVPDGMKPGSDVANLSCMGYDPRECYTGRSPLEAASMGIDLKPGDIAFRCNLVTLSDAPDYTQKTMVDYCAGDISTKEADELIKTIHQKLSDERVSFYTGISYRHCMVWANGLSDMGFLTPPHDITDRTVKDYLPKGGKASLILDLMKKSHEILKDHPVNLKRKKEGKRPANSIWLWGQGSRPSIGNFYEKYGLKGSVVSAVDLIKGIGKCAGMHVCEVEGATGYIDTNFEGKTKAALDELKNGQDFVYIHIEAPDECGHRGETDNKIKSIELIDNRVLATLLKGLEAYEDYKILLLPDHPTPLSIKTHTSDPVPFLIFQKSKQKDNGIQVFGEEAAKKSGCLIESGSSMINRLLK